jgi:hypothetical protein
VNLKKNKTFDPEKRLKNDVVLEWTDIVFVNLPSLSFENYLSLAWLVNQGYVPEDETQFRSLRFQNLQCHVWDRERLILEIMRYRAFDNEQLVPLVTDLHLRRLAQSEPTVSDEFHDNVKFYTFHFRHHAERRLMAERRDTDKQQKGIVL